MINKIHTSKFMMPLRIQHFWVSCSDQMFANGNYDHSSDAMHVGQTTEQNGKTHSRSRTQISVTASGRVSVSGKPDSCCSPPQWASTTTQGGLSWSLHCPNDVTINSWSGQLTYVLYVHINIKYFIIPLNCLASNCSVDVYMKLISSNYTYVQYVRKHTCVCKSYQIINHLCSTFNDHITHQPL